MTSDQFRPPSVPDGLLPEEKGEMTTEHPRPPSMPEAAMTAASFQPPAIPDGLCPEEAQKFLEAHGFAHNLKHKTGGSYVYMMVAPVLAPGASLESFILYVNQLLAESGNPTDPLERLLVEHPLESGPTRDSWWEIVTWPGLDRYARGGGVFDADFTRSARWYGDGEGVPGRIEVTKLLTGRQESFENPYESGNAAWDADGRLVLTDYESGEATAHALDGSVLDRWDRVGNYVSTSADHSTLVFWYWDQLDEPQVLSVLKDTELTSVTTPAPFFVGFDAVHVSPDGSAMVIVCYLAGQERALLFRL